MRIIQFLAAAAVVAAVVTAIWISGEAQTERGFTAPPPARAPEIDGHRLHSTAVVGSTKPVEIEVAHKPAAEPPPELEPSLRSLGFAVGAPSHPNTTTTQAEQLASLDEELQRIRADALAAGASPAVAEALSAHQRRIDDMVVSVANAE
jgi:hypothetical protein